MNIRTFYATLAGFIIYFLLSWLVYGVLLLDFYEANSMQYEGLMKEMPDMLLMVVGGIVWAFFIVYIFQVIGNVRTAGKGFTAGLILTFLILLSYDLYFMASMNLFNWMLMIVDVVFGSIVGGIVGAVTAFVIGFSDKKPVKS